MSWRDELRGVVHEIARTTETGLDEVRRRLRRRIERRDPVMIQPYRGYAGEGGVWLRGRVLEDEGIGPAEADASTLENLWDMALRFESDELPGVGVRARLGERAVEVVTDEEGYFEVTIEAPDLPDSAWLDVRLELTDPPFAGPAAVRATGRARIVHPDAEFGVLSDIDDTVLPSGATSLLTLARSTLLGNAASRTPFAGVRDLYRALEAGPGGVSGRNPFFYVSSSPWNLYDFLEEFMARNGIPAGPILLRDLGVDETKLIKGGHDHKLEKIDRIFGAFPHLRFVLIGDSGQEDPVLYREAVERYPGRVLAIYIRSVPGVGRGAWVAEHVERTAAHGVAMRLVPDSAAALALAAEAGLIAARG